MASSPKTIQRRGVESNVLSIVIADESGQIKLQLWDTQISTVKIQTSYVFTNLSVREYGKEKFLTTTRNSTIKEIDTVPVAETTVSIVLEEDDAPHTVATEVVAVKLGSYYNCGSCFKRQSTSFNSKQPFHRCEGCQFLRKSAMFRATTSGLLHTVVDGVEIALTLNNSVLRSFLETQRLTHLLDDTESLEMYFLTSETVKISFNAERFITQLSQTEPDSTAAPVPPPPAATGRSNSGESESWEELEELFKE